MEFRKGNRMNKKCKLCEINKEMGLPECLECVSARATYREILEDYVKWRKKNQNKIIKITGKPQGMAATFFYQTQKINKILEKQSAYADPTFIEIIERNELIKRITRIENILIDLSYFKRCNYIYLTDLQNTLKKHGLIKEFNQKEYEKKNTKRNKLINEGNKRRKPKTIK